jgi:hypothetical protein
VIELVRDLYRIPSNSSGRLFARPGAKGLHPGVETPVTPDEVDELDAGDEVEEFVRGAWRRTVFTLSLVNSEGLLGNLLQKRV